MASISHVVQFSADEICQQSQQLAAAFVVTTIALLKERQESVTEWFSASRQKYAAHWEDLRGQGALAVLRVIALNATCIGATVESLDGNTSVAELVITNWPSPWFLYCFVMDRVHVLPPRDRGNRSETEAVECHTNRSGHSHIPAVRSGR